MLNLRSKMLEAGLITEKEAKIAEQSTNKKKTEHKDKHLGDEHLKRLQDLNKGEQYELIRKWVKRNRLDKSLLSDEGQRYFFEREDKSIAWLSIEPDVFEHIKEGTAAIIAFMSDHGMSHCVIPREIAQDIGQIFPEWIRVLKDETKRE